MSKHQLLRLFKIEKMLGFKLGRLIYATGMVFRYGFSNFTTFPRQNFKYRYGIIWVSFSVLRYHFGIAKFQSSFGHFLGSILNVSHLKPERSSRHYGILLVSLLKP